MGSAMDVFTDLVKLTGPTIYSGGEHVANEATLNSYTLNWINRGRDMSEMLQGTPKIIDFIYFDERGKRQHYAMSEEFDYPNAQTVSQWEVEWRFTAAMTQYAEHELGLNMGELNSTARAMRYKNLLKAKMMDLWTTNVNGYERDLWAVPLSTKMEGRGAGRLFPYSIPTFINEFSDYRTTPTTGGANDGHYSGWSTVMGLDPGTQGKWHNQRATYSNAGSYKGLYKAFSRVYSRCKFEQLPFRPEYSDKTSVPGVIFTMEEGMTAVEAGAVENQDFFRGGFGSADAGYRGLSYKGLPIVYISILDAAAIFPTGSGGALSTWSDTTNSNAGPRFFFVNPQHLKMVWHKDRYFYMKEPFSPSRQPFNKVIIADCWHNLVCTSRSRHGYVNPSDTITFI